MFRKIFSATQLLEIEFIVSKFLKSKEEYKFSRLLFTKRIKKLPLRERVDYILEHMRSHDPMWDDFYTFYRRNKKWSDL